MIAWIQIPLLKDNYSVLLHSARDGWTAVIDPAEADPIRDVLDARGWTLDYILNTHHHGDHVGGNRTLKALYGARVFGAEGPNEVIPVLDEPLWSQDQLQFGQTMVQILKVPGHTKRHLAFYFPEEGWLFAGDTLFSLGCGRLLGGTAESLWSSLDRLRQLPAATQIFCAHEYTLANGQFALHVDPDNPALRAHLERAVALRRQGRPTVPFDLQGELSANPFLRPESRQIRRHLGLADAPDLEVFRALRAQKDVFSA